MSGLQVAHVIETCRGGVGTMVRNLIYSQASDPCIDTVHLIGDREQMVDMLDGAPAIWHDYKASRNPLKIIGVSRVVQETLATIQPDIVYLHSTFPGVYGRLFAPVNAHWSRIFCAHGWCFSQKVSPIRRFLYKTAEARLSKVTEGIVSISFDEFERARRAGVQPMIHRIIPNGVREPRLSSQPVNLPFNTEQINIGFVGRFDPDKGLDLVLEALRDEKLSHITLWLVGAGVRNSVLVEESDQVKRIGWVHNDRIDDYIACFDALIVPSRWEGFGLAAVEAMRNGKPVLASHVGGLPELVIHRWNGYLFESGSVEAIRHVLKSLNKPELDRMGLAAREVSSVFSWDTCYAEWRKLTQDVLALRKPRPE